MSGYESFLSTTATGPTYTELAREVERLREQVALLTSGRQYAGEIRQQAFLELAEDLAAMEPAARDAAIRRIIDSHQ